MKTIPRISEGEWKVMSIIWEKSPCTANEIIEILEDDTEWKPKTIKTMISRLVKKGAIGYETDGRTYHYFPLVSEEVCIKSENKSFLERVHKGAFNLMLASFLKEEDLSEKEIEELKKILSEKNNDNGRT